MDEQQELAVYLRHLAWADGQGEHDWAIARLCWTTCRLLLQRAHDAPQLGRALQVEARAALADLEANRTASSLDFEATRAQAGRVVPVAQRVLQALDGRAGTLDSG